MEKHSFYKFHSIFEAQLKAYFFHKGGKKYDPTGSAKRGPPTDYYLIKIIICFSITIRYFYGGSLIDIMILHGVSFISVFKSTWVVVGCVNSFIELEIFFPRHENQTYISNIFKEMSGAYFDNVIGDINGL